MAKPQTAAEWESAYNDLATSIGRTFGPRVDPVSEHAENVAHANTLMGRLVVLESENATLKQASAREQAKVAARAKLTPEQLAALEIN